MQKLKINTVLFLLLMIGLWLPFMMNQLPNKYKATVFGVEEPIKQDTVSWYDGTAQVQFESNLINQSLVRTYLLRLRNQYQYSLFGKINAHNIYQFGDYFFRFYSYGFNEDNNFLGKEIIQLKVDELKKLQDFLGDSIPIITIIAPSKVRYYENMLPERYHTKTKETNYDYLLEDLKAANLNCIDFNNYFQKHKSVCPAIFGNGGTHWTHYATAIAMDSVVRYISALKNTEYNQFKYTTKKNNGFNVDDLDIALLRNLFTKPKDTNLRDVVVSSDNLHKKINAVIVGDSYFLTVQNTRIRNLIFTDNSDYHYYFRRTYDKDYKEKAIDYQKIKQQLRNADCVILITDIVNIEIFGFGFPEKILSLP
ncbi:MAG: hypothetical protein ABI207_04155 [Crocinitomicaceae bacterium]